MEKYFPTCPFDRNQSKINQSEIHHTLIEIHIVSAELTTFWSMYGQLYSWQVAINLILLNYSIVWLFEKDEVSI